MRSHGEGSYWQRPSGTWRYRVMVDGRKVDGNGDTKKAARDDAKEKIKRRGAKTTPDTVDTLFVEWKRRGYKPARLRPSTFDQYVSLITTHVKPVIGDVLVKDLTRQKIATVFDGMNTSASTKRSTYAAIVKLVDYAIVTDQLAVNVARQVPRPSSDASRHREVGGDALGKMLKAAREHRWEVAVWLAFGLGLRRGEMLGLRWSDIDWDTHTASISKRGNVVRSSAGLQAGLPKTRAGVRKVPISAPVEAALKRHETKQKQLRLSAPVWEDSGHVLTTHLGGVVEPRALSRVWKSWATKAGLEDTGIHVSRHYAATVMLASGKASVADIAAALGHDPTVLLTTYASAVADGQRQAADALGSSLSKAAEGNSEGNSSKTDGLHPETSVTSMSQKRSSRKGKTKTKATP